MAVFVAALWLLFCGPAYALRGQLALEGLSYAAILCLLPGLVLFAVFTPKPGATSEEANNQRAMLMLAGMMGRMIFVLLGTLAIQEFRSELTFWDFLVWLIAFYLCTLAYETSLLLKRQSTAVSQSGGAGE